MEVELRIYVTPLRDARYCRGLIADLREYKGVSHVHVMAGDHLMIIPGSLIYHLILLVRMNKEWEKTNYVRGVRQKTQLRIKPHD